jgi:CheY-like chemotaxis protein
VGVSVQELPLVLVIEDDPDIQIVLEDALTEGGFEPAIAASGEEGVTLLKSGLIKYRALVTDVILKGRMDGWEVAKQSREIDPAFPIVYITGEAVRRWPSRGVPNSIPLEKPFAPAQLVTAVSQLLNTGTPLAISTSLRAALSGSANGRPVIYFIARSALVEGYSYFCGPTCNSNVPKRYSSSVSLAVLTSVNVASGKCHQIAKSSAVTVSQPNLNMYRPG